jgi:hypothetical protein
MAITEVTIGMAQRLLYFKKKRPEEWFEKPKNMINSSSRSSCTTLVNHKDNLKSILDKWMDLWRV